MTDIEEERALDNPVWSCLTTRHAHLAQGDDFARRYASEISPLSGVLAADPAHVPTLLDLVDAGEELGIFCAEVGDLPGNWEVMRRARLVQMIRRDATPLPARDVGIEPLSVADIDAMLELVELTHPGPFRPRTPELGNFFGIRGQGKLIAMT